MQEGGSVVGFEVPRSPDSSYNNPIPGNEDEAREPPLVPPHLHHTLLNYPHGQDDPSSLSMPQNVILNHLYIGNRDGPRSVVALGITHRVRSKYVTVVLYKPVQRRWTPFSIGLIFRRADWFGCDQTDKVKTHSTITHLHKCIWFSLSFRQVFDVLHSSYSSQYFGLWEFSCVIYVI